MSKIQDLAKDQAQIIAEEQQLQKKQAEVQGKIEELLAKMQEQQNQEDQQDSNPDDGDDSGDDQDGDSEGQGDDQDGEGKKQKKQGESGGDEEGDGSGDPSDEEGDGQGGSGGNGEEEEDDGYEGPRVLDNHEMWRTGSDDPEDQKMTLQNALNQAKEDCIRQYGPDSIPNNIKEMLNETLKAPRINWEKILRQFIGRKMSFDKAATRKRPNRRLGLKSPGKTHKMGPRTLFAVDCSGSVRDEEYLKIMAEIVGAAKHYPDKVDTIFFDTELSELSKLGAVKKIPRRPFQGGTDFQPVIDFAIEYKPDLLIILTDGAAPTPTKPNCPVLWVIIGGSDNPKLYGQRIVVDDNSNKKISKTIGF